MATDTKTSTRDGDRLIIRPRLGPNRDVLVLILLRGGMDGLYAIPPFGDAGLVAARAGFSPIEPSRKRSSAGVINLDDFFGLHPLLAPLEPLYRDGQLAIIQAAGLNVPILSHFDATAAIERGTAGEGLHDGWIARHLLTDSRLGGSPLRAVAFEKTLPASLLGVSTSVFESLDEFRLQMPPGWDTSFMKALSLLYRRGADCVSRAGRYTLATYETVRRLSSSRGIAEYGAQYPTDAFGRRLFQLAQLIKAEVGLEAAVLGLADWDSHVSQNELLQAPMQQLAGGLAALVQDLGPRMRRTTIVVMSEFGRRTQPNEGGGTDHGRATAIFAIGGGIAGGKIYGSWPGLGKDQLDDDGNLRVTTDYRSVLAEIVKNRLGNPAVDRVFPKFEPTYLNFTRS